MDLVFYDDKSLRQRAREITKALLERDRVDLLFGPYSSVLTLEAAAVAQEHERVLWNHGGATDKTADMDWVVNVLTPAGRYFHGVIDLVLERVPHANRVAIVHSSRGSFPHSVATGAERYARDHGFQEVFKTEYDPSLRENSGLLDDLRAAKHDLLLGVGRLEDDISLARRLTEEKIDAGAVSLVATPTQRFKEALGQMTDGFLGPSQWEYDVFPQPEYGPTATDAGLTGAEYPKAQAYAAGLVAQRCVEEAGTLEDGALREAARRLDFTTFYGRFKLDPASGRQMGHDMVVVQWQGDEKLVVWPPKPTGT
jgi:branched-chain amino acid transport system substrate-binding protein